MFGNGRFSADDEDESAFRIWLIYLLVALGPSFSGTHFSRLFRLKTLYKNIIVIKATLSEIRLYNNL